MVMKSFSNNAVKYIYIVESILFLILCCLFVPKIDDIIFNYNEFFQFDDFRGFINSTLYYGNGRILGNGLSILFSKIPCVFYVVEFLLVQLFCIITEKLIGIKNSKLYFLTFFVLQPIFLVNHIESWLCGFINYFVPIILLFTILLILKNNEKVMSPFKIAIRCIFITFLGVAEQLFIQHNALMNLIIAITVLVAFIIKKKKIYECVLLIISNIIGCIILFGYNYYIDFEKTWVYKYMGNTGSATILSSTSFDDAIRVLASNMGLFIYFYFACIMCYTIILFAILHIDKKEHKIRMKKLNVFLLLIYYPIAGAVFVFYILDKLSDVRFAVILVALFVANLIGLLYAYSKTIFLNMPKNLKIITTLILFYGIASFTPFVIYKTLGAFRGLMFAYVFIGIFTLIVANYVHKQYNFNIRKQVLTFSIIGCIVCGAYIPAYAVQKEIYNYKAQNYQSEYYLPEASRVLVDQDLAWQYAEGNIEHKYVKYMEFKEMQKHNVISDDSVE